MPTIWSPCMQKACPVAMSCFVGPWGTSLCLFLVEQAPRQGENTGLTAERLVTDHRNLRGICKSLTSVAGGRRQACDMDAAHDRSHVRTTMSLRSPPTWSPTWSPSWSPSWSPCKRGWAHVTCEVKVHKQRRRERVKPCQRHGRRACRKHVRSPCLALSVLGEPPCVSSLLNKPQGKERSQG